MPFVRRAGVGGSITILAAALAAAATAAPPVSSEAAVRLLGEQIVAHGLRVDATTVGGLSGIDYSPRTDEYVLISDDRSIRDPARVYTARIPVGEHGVGPVTFTGTRTLRGPGGDTYPPDSIDPEELRVDPWTGDYLWSQEGDRGPHGLRDPSVRLARPDGSYLTDLPIPNNERMQPDSGPRGNGVLEGATFAGGGALVVTSVEAPLLQDGPEATAGAGALTRITVQARTGQLLAQYAYPLEPVFAPGPGANGVASILAADPLDPTKYLVLERAFVEGAGTRIRIYSADTGPATDVLDAPLTGAHPVTKQLLTDLSTLDLPAVDNIEGMTWGPRLPSGERTLVLVSDDNFADNQITQIVALAVR
ncbi:esterase-like activity of phytase family protein [Nocardia spumae]|uniref:esterase-like activity of phytase family protein n=1 Tax=Nocardia spumae TaxID=2887190 RepID=UPI001D155C38|nr:esterase-like activity of phytase family protein [Nocardia spumae]